ncbi:MAG: hypothetical protein AB7V62_06485 [Thermoleophilia bacterium]
MTIVDLGNRKVLKRFALGAPGSLSPAGDGRHVLAGISATGRVKVLDGGSWAVPHGDHAHHYVRAPRVRATVVADRPAHIVGHGSRVAIFNDGTGVAAVLEHSRLGRGARGAVRIRTGTPHHGVAVPMGDRYIVSLQANAADDLPGTLAIATRTGRLTGTRIPCAAMHGEADLGATRAAFACADGYVVIDTSGPRVRTTRVAPAPGIAPEARSFTLSTAEGLPYAIGDLDAQTLVRVDPRTRTSATIPVPGARGAFALDADSRSVIVVTTDGRVHQIDPLTGAVRGSVQAVGAFSLSGGFSVPRPRIAIGEQRRVYVSDPANGRVVELATNPLRVTRTFAVGGAPVTMAVLGTE